MSRFGRIAGVLAVVMALALGTVAIVSAEGPRGGTWDWAGRLQEAIANALGITVDEYDAAVDTAQGQVLQEAVNEGLLTEEQAERLQERALEGTFRGYGHSFMGRGRFDRGYALRGPGSSIVYVAAELMDLTVQELVAELEDGKSIADVAGARGVELQEIVDAWLADRVEFLSQAVEAGRITQEQADEHLAHMEEESLEHLQNTWPWEHDPEECEENMLGGLGGFGGWHMGPAGRGDFGAGRSFGGCY